MGLCRKGKQGKTRTVVLVHGVGVLGPGDEVVLVQGELLRVGLDVGGVFVEEDLSTDKLAISTLPVQPFLTEK